MSLADSTLAKLMDRLLKIPGVTDAVLLPQELKKEILASELREECESKGFFQKYNAGLRDALKRDGIIAVFTNDLYKYPPEPIELVCYGETVGREIKDRTELKSLSEDANNMILGDSFVIFKDKLPKDNLKKVISGEIRIFIPPMSVGFNDVEDVYGLVLAMPSTGTDMMLKDWLRRHGISTLDERTGVILVGFNMVG